jgi:UrcA family protein
MFVKIRFAALVVGTVLGAAGALQAAPSRIISADAQSPSVTVPLADLDLTAETGAKVVLKRIHSAAMSVCSDELSPLACWNDTVRRAVATLGNPIVAALAAGHRQSATVLATRGR